MELRKGYKQTEIGIIPNEWHVNKLSEITNLMTNGFVGTATSFYSESDSDILYIQGYNVEENGFNFRGIKYVTKDFHKQHSKSSLQEGDLLTIQTGDVGLTTIVPKELVGSNCHALIISRFKKEKFDSKYYSYYFNSFIGRSRLKSIETGTTMKHINVGDLLEFVVPIPTKTEQTAIAKALNDADVLISSLEKLIEKKRNIKQGAMQELLRANPDSNREGWVVKKLGEICENLSSGKSKTQSNEGIYPIYGSTGIIGMDKSFDYQGNKILVARVGANAGTVNMVEGKYCVSDNTLMITLKSEIDLHFIFYYLINFRLNRLVFGSGQPLITSGQLNVLEVSIPINKEEQNLISTILRDMDNEITSLEKKLSKSKMLKQGMMQELLTGKIRLTWN